MGRRHPTTGPRSEEKSPLEDTGSKFVTEPSGKLYYRNQFGWGRKNRKWPGWYDYEIRAGGHKELLTGEEDVSTWTTAELRHGRKGYRGPVPRLLPAVISEELTRRTLAEARQALQDGLIESIEELVEMASGRKPARGDQIRAINIVMDRVMGKSPEMVTVNVEQPWQKVLKAGISRDEPEEDDGIIDAEIVDEEDDQDWEF